eukprot:2066618-Rhodomonas_salina.1
MNEKGHLKAVQTSLPKQLKLKMKLCHSVAHPQFNFRFWTSKVQALSLSSKPSDHWHTRECESIFTRVEFDIGGIARNLGIRGSPVGIPSPNWPVTFSKRRTFAPVGRRISGQLPCPKNKWGIPRSGTPCTRMEYLVPIDSD